MKTTEGFSLSGVVHHRGSDGYGLNATINLDGKKVGSVFDSGGGGGLEVHFESRTHREALEARALHWWDNEGGAAQYETDMRKFDPDYKVDADDRTPWALCDSYIEHLVEQDQNEKEVAKLAGMAKRKTLFRLKGEKYREGEWHTLGAPYSAAVQAQLDRKYPGRVEVIYGVTPGNALKESCALPAA